MKRIQLFALAVFVSCFAAAANDNPYVAKLSGVPVSDLPAKAAALLSEAKANNHTVLRGQLKSAQFSPDGKHVITTGQDGASRVWDAQTGQLASKAPLSSTLSNPLESTATDLITAAVQANPASAPASVAALCRVTPEVSSQIAGAAAAKVPQLAAYVAKAAARAVPSQAGAIVSAVCRAAPGEYRNIALAAADAVPGAGSDILAALAETVPSLKTVIGSRVAAGQSPTVAEVLAQQGSASKFATSGSPSANLSVPGSASGPPYIPLSTTPNNLAPGVSGNVPPAGRDSARP